MPRSADTVGGLLRLTNILIRDLAPLFEKQKLTPQQWFVLAALAESSDPPTLAGLARSLMVSKQNMTGMVNRLTTLGLIARSGDPADLRASRLQLSRRGRSTHQRLLPAFNRWADRRLGLLSSSDQKSLARALDQLGLSRESGD